MRLADCAAKRATISRFNYASLDLREEKREWIYKYCIMWHIQALTWLIYWKAWRLSFIESCICNFRDACTGARPHDKGVSSDDDECHAYVTSVPRSILRPKRSINCVRARFQSRLRGLLNEIILRRLSEHSQSSLIPMLSAKCNRMSNQR